MKILLVNTYDKGGAANACIRLHKALLNQGVSSKLLILKKTKDLPHSYAFKNNSKKNKTSLVFRIFKKFATIFGLELKQEDSAFEIFKQQRTKGLEMFSDYSSNIDITESKHYKEADVINLHWVVGFLDYQSFFLKNTKPIVWTLHDMHPFSNGPHYMEWFCQMLQSGVPEKRNMSTEELYWINKFKVQNTEIFKNVNNMAIISPSKWLMDCSLESELFSGYSHYNIPNGIDPKVFKNMSKEFCRQVLNIPNDKKVVLFVAEYFVKWRKGFEFMNLAVEELKGEDLLLCNVGNQDSLIKSTLATNFGVVSDQRMLSIIYNAADVFVIPSLMDNLPNTVLESLMCGTPVIGFNIGGIPDMINHGDNGLLVEELSAHKLAEAIKTFFKIQNNFNNEEISITTRNQFSSKIQAKAYHKVFKHIFKN